MRWEDERYVRSYTRDTVTWKMLPWESRMLLLALLRKLDRAGLMDVGGDGVQGIAAMVEVPVDFVERALPELLKRQVFTWTSTFQLFMPNYVAAQESASSDAQRKRDQRERDSAKANLLRVQGDLPLTKSGHELSQAVTNGHSVPSRTVPSLTKERERVPLPDLGTPENAKQQRAVDAHIEDAIDILGRLNDARMRVIPGARLIRATYSSLAGIAARLVAGKTSEECRHVIAACEAECRANAESRRYFDATSPWRPDNFERNLARPIIGLVPTTFRERQ